MNNQTIGAPKKLEELKDYKNAKDASLHEQIKKGNIQAQSKALGELLKRIKQ